MNTNILIIDDDTSLRRVLEYNLQEAGYTVTAAASGEEGVYFFKQAPCPLVITDMKMAGMDGMEVLKQVRQLRPETLVIIITAYGTVNIAVEAMKSGAYDYITKPFNRDELIMTVAKALQFSSLTTENRQLRNELANKIDFRIIVGTSPQMTTIFQTIRKVAPTDATVLISGESGTGKELVARSIHAQSLRHNGPFIAVNCSAIPNTLLESELFGHVKGAFTGAVKDHAGKFELADGGTIFLDEIGELPLELQPKLLRAIQERVVEPVGGTWLKKLDIRIIAATNLDLSKALSAGHFREDLYYRLAVIPLQIPPLRERSNDIPLLLRHFCQKHGAPDVCFTKEASEQLERYEWPGNIRELENLVERLLIMRNGNILTLDDIPDTIRRKIKPQQHHEIINLPPEGCSLEELEHDIIKKALLVCGWNQTAAARFLRIPRHTLIYRMGKYRISPDE